MRNPSEARVSIDRVRRRSRLILSLLFSLLVAGAAAPAVASELPPGFSDVKVVGGLSDPTAMQLANDGRLFICERSGTVRVVRDGILLQEPFATLPVHAAGERGLLGLALDPSFDTNGFVYVYYTAATPSVHNRVSRLTASGDVAAPGSEVVILDLEPAGRATRRNGGALRFAPDGTLYIGVGDHGFGSRAQLPESGHGKVLRLESDGTIPFDNPGSSRERPRAVWASGLRAPSAIGIHARTGDVLINDAGGLWNEINEGLPGVSYGWPSVEGPRSVASHVAPLHTFAGDVAPEARCGVTGGAFYDPDLALFPAEFHDAFFFADSCRGSISWLDAGDRIASPFATEIARPVALEVSRDGALYYLTDPNSSPGEGAVHRVTFSGAAGTGAPADDFAVTHGSATRPLLAADTVVQRIVVSTTTQFRSALGSATAGTVIALNPGIYSGGNYKSNLAGTADRSIVIEAADPSNRPIIRGGGEGLKLSDARYVTLRNLIVEGQTANGINIDDTPGFSTPSHHIRLEGVVVRNLQGTGNIDGIKLSGVQDFVLDGVTVINWGSGGSAVDMVGCHRGEIRNSTFRQFPGNTGGNGVQAKGGSTGIIVRGNRFEHAAARAVQLGGATSLTLFRPQPHAAYEARDCLVERNIFIGGETAVAFANLDGSVVRYNTIYRSTRWTLRILQENRDASMVPSRRGVFTDNILYGDAPITSVNVGSGTAGSTFVFARNWWYRADAPSSSKPVLPSPETSGVYGVDPQFVNPGGGDFRLKAGTPAAAYGAYAGAPGSTPSTGTGLRGEYYDNHDFTALRMMRTDPSVNFTWGTGGETGMGVDTFSVRWTGRIQAAATETYTLYTQSDDGVRLWVNGVLLINDWTSHPTKENRGSIALAAGQSYDVKLEYFEGGGSAVVRLLWESPSTPKAVIPRERLFLPPN